VQLGVIEDEELLDVFWAIEENAARAHHGHADDVPVFVSETLQSPQGIFANIEREAQNGQPPGSGRYVVSVDGHFARPEFTSTKRNTQRKTS
jgi:hypothetical protein